MRVKVINLLTESDIANLFHRSPQSVALYRKHKKLPYICIKGDEKDFIRYELKSALEWAKKVGKRVYDTDFYTVGE